MFDALILTPWMTPHHVVPWYESICLQFTGKADVLEAYDETVCSPSVTVRIPAVLRLTKAMARTKKDVKFSRANVYARDGHRCQYCNRPFPPKSLNYDHVVPRSRGGRTTWDNIVTSCLACNRKKANRTPEQAGMRLVKRPSRPKSLPIAYLVALPTDVPSLWLPYLQPSDRATHVA